MSGASAAAGDGSGGAARRREIAVGVIGLGLMGRTHIAAWRAAARAGNACRVVAVADPSPERLTGRAAVAGNLPEQAVDEPLFDPRAVRTGTDAATVLDDSDVEVVSICTPTDTHVDLARRALERGRHVLVEKPVSLDARAIDDLSATAARAGRICMPAMCMRFWPGWSWLREAVRDGRHGAVLSATFQRLGARPAWNPGFYGDRARSGGALFDLHVHDADLVHWLFGPPDSITATGTADHVTALYRYARGPAHVVLEGGWLGDGGFPFRMRYVVEFERATAEFDLRREPRLELVAAGRVESPTLDDWTGYDGEVRALLDAVRSAEAGALPTLAEAAAVTRSIQAYGLGGLTTGAAGSR
ncbi:MAG: Gfo/Idh/MocA family oxidoreductase [Planctomycetes bacterium]|nr:Gfo/Idh/MocA family oxidoreductase [Planctomycetota bacterium]